MPGAPTATQVMAPTVATSPHLSATAARVAEAQAQAAALKQQLLAIPALEGTGIDPAARGKDILAHLSAVLRLYRSAVTPVQKVGEPSDVLYQEETAADAAEIATYAFQAARTEAALLSKIPVKGALQPAEQTAASTPTEAQRIAAARASAAQRAQQLQSEDAANDRAMATAKPKDMPPLLQVQERLDGEIKLQKAIIDALARVAVLSDTPSNTGLTGDIDRLQRSAPELINAKPAGIAPAPVESLASSRDAGVTSQAVVLFQLLSTRHAIDQRIADNAELHRQALELRTPLLNILRKTIGESQTATAGGSASGTAPGTAPGAAAGNAAGTAAGAGAAAGTAAGAGAAAGTAAGAAAAGSDGAATASVAAIRKHFDTLTATFNVLSEATVPLSQELLVLDQDRGNLLSWRIAIDGEYRRVIRDLLTRVMGIALALGVLFLLSEVWRRATLRYVSDLRRRRQLLVVRRLVIYFLSGIIVIFGFVTQFNSLATFAGFITAGIAVGLQTILLSVAAYFFIIGRYGVRVGDRITIAAVTGDVIEVGLVRFYIAELAGTGTELHSTGRVAVFSNAVLFQAATPLYKQMPGTEFAWHELTVKLNPDEDYQPATTAITAAVTGIFETYRANIEQQHKQVESWMDTAIAAPAVESRLQLADTGLQFAILFPVEIRSAAEIDERITEALLTSLGGNEAAKKAIAAPPVIKASIKG